jgi:hypothetical protein
VAERSGDLFIKAPEDNGDLLLELLFTLQQQVSARYPDEAPLKIARLKSTLDERRSRLSIPEVCTPLELPVSVFAPDKNLSALN